eukprot:TRINITY_DN112945_c0_g1_i1.p1 TRINITY_DN112945_c0_g1~~TRINITY_DN112945_c0_g1_i1.p1  ORF type:complete len:243 (-),score=61.95 TRINITY_DN112945_c0_g1_i1:3-731(-)
MRALVLAAPLLLLRRPFTTRVVPRGLVAHRAMAASASSGLEEALVWIDCEMTGLGGGGGPGDDQLLEVACLLTDADLNIVAEGPDLVLRHPPAVLDGMNDWCKKQFGWQGIDKAPTPGLLADEVLRSEVSVEEADRQLHEFVSRHVAKGVGVLAGNTAHMDKRFLDKFCPQFMGHLHYRLVDVSTLKELCRRWYPEDFKNAPKKKGYHRAMDDIRESLEELRYYRQAVCKPPSKKLRGERDA